MELKESSIFIFEIISIPGIPKGVVNVVYGKGDVIGKAMAEHPTVKALALVNIDHIFADGFRSKYSIESVEAQWPHC